jgi:hypothetical protein
MLIEAMKLRSIVAIFSLMGTNVQDVQCSPSPNFFTDLLNRFAPKPVPVFPPCQTDADCASFDATSVCSDTNKVCVGCRNADALCAMYNDGRCTQGLSCVSTPWEQRCVMWKCECDGGNVTGHKYCGPYFLNGTVPEEVYLLAFINGFEFRTVDMKGL